MATQEREFPLLELPILALEKIISFITDPYDLKVFRRTCTTTRDLVNNSQDSLLHLKVIPKDLKIFENVVQNETHIKWNNFRFPPELYYVGCRRHYVDTFNKLFSSFTEKYSPHVQILEMDRFDFSNVHHVNLLKHCQKLIYFKADAILIKGISEHKLKDILQDRKLLAVLEKLQSLDVTAFEFLIHEYQFQFMGKLLQKCVNLRNLGSWGYFPEWEQPIGGAIHLKHFIWPLLVYLKGRYRAVSAMLESVDSLVDLKSLNLQFLNDTMDWQSGKWILNLEDIAKSDCTDLEHFLYSRIKSYSHRAVGWFDEAEFRKAGLALMKNLTTVHIHNARDIKLGEPSPIPTPLFPKLCKLTLIVGNRLTCFEENEQDRPLEKVVVDMLLSTYRPSVQNLALDIDLDHHHHYGSIHLSSVIRNFPNLHSCRIEEWGPTDLQMLEIYGAFPQLEVLMFCGRNLSDVGIIGNRSNGSDSSNAGIRKLKNLRILKVFSIRQPPKNVFPWPIKENNQITNKSFQWGFSQMGLRKFHFLIKSDKISRTGLGFLLNERFSKTVQEFAMNWLPEDVKSRKDFERLHQTFKFLDPQNEPANFVIPDIGKWVL